MAKNRTPQNIASFSIVYFVLAAFAGFSVLLTLLPIVNAETSTAYNVATGVICSLLVIAGIGTIKQHYYLGYILGNLMLLNFTLSQAYAISKVPSSAIHFNLILLSVGIGLIYLLNFKLRAYFLGTSKKLTSKSQQDVEKIAGPSFKKAVNA